jgi:outer membrane protein assembly factor BamB
MKTCWCLLAGACWLLLAAQASAGDWPQFGGPDRDSVSKETGLLKSWPADGPKLLWTYNDAGIGHSGPAVVGEKLYTLGAKGDSEYLFAIDVKGAGAGSIKPLWTTRVGPIFTWKVGKNRWGDGPRSTPTVDGELVFALGGMGDLLCVDAGSGSERWRKELRKELGAVVNDVGGSEKMIGWGFSWSPLVDGEQLICMPGGSQGTIAALDKKTGRVLWQSKEVTYTASYSSPIVAQIGGVRQYIFATNEGVTGVAAADGRLLWHFDKDFSDVLCPTPIFHDGEVYVTAMGSGCELIKLTASGKKIKPTSVYRNRNMTNDHGGVLLVDGHLYGYSDGKGWICHEWKKPGKVIWRDKHLGKGSVTAADGSLYCYAEDDGTVVLADASPAGWKQKGRFTIPQKSPSRKDDAKIWTHPVIAEGKLYLRDQELIFCYQVR